MGYKISEKKTCVYKGATLKQFCKYIMTSKY